MTVDDDDFLAPVAGHLVRGFLQEFKLQMQAVSDGSRLVPSLKDLRCEVLRKDDGEFLLGRMQRSIPNVQQVVAQGQMQSVFLQNPYWQKACVLGLTNGLHKVRRSQLLPLHGRRLSRRDARHEQHDKEKNWAYDSSLTTLHDSEPPESSCGTLHCPTRHTQIEY